MLKASPRTASAGRSEEGDGGGGDVANVDERTPGRPVTLEVDRTGSVRPADEVVQHDVEPRRGDAPYAVAFRIETGAKSESASSNSASSARTFDSA